MSFLFWLVKSHSSTHSEQKGVLTILLKAEGNTSVVRGAGKRARPAPVLCRDSGAASASAGMEEEGEKNDTFEISASGRGGESIPLWKHLYLKAEHPNGYGNHSAVCRAAVERSMKPQLQSSPDDSSPELTVLGKHGF